MRFVVSHPSRKNKDAARVGHPHCSDYIRRRAERKASHKMNSFSSRAKLTSGNRTYTIYSLPALKARGFNLSRLPFSLKILLENLLRREDGVIVTAADIEFLAKWEAKAVPSREIAYMPGGC